MSFHNVRLPEFIERGARGGPDFRTNIQTLANGFERRNVEWQYARKNFDIAYGVQRKSAQQAAIGFSVIMEFFYARRGRAYGFRFRDYSDYQVGINLASGLVDATSPQFLIAGDGSATQVQLFKRYTDAGGSYDHPITRPIESTVRLFEGDQTTEIMTFSVDATTGVLTKDTAFSNATNYYVAFEYDVPVRFDNDGLPVELTWQDAGSIPSIDLVELREALTEL